MVDGSGHLQVFGGFNGDPTNGVYNTLYTYTGSAWSAGPSLPQATEDAAAVSGPDGADLRAGRVRGALAVERAGV